MPYTLVQTKESILLPAVVRTYELSIKEFCKTPEHFVGMLTDIMKEVLDDVEYGEQVFLTFINKAQPHRVTMCEKLQNLDPVSIMLKLDKEMDIFKKLFYNDQFTAELEVIYFRDK
jgi:hypothetical protein